MSAMFSTCNRYRYSLARSVGLSSRVVAFVGVNPSTADADFDDATVRKWRGFAERWGFGGFTVGNLFGWRATDVRELARVDDPIGPQNDAALRLLLTRADLVVPCWGDRRKIPKRLWPRIDAVRELIHEAGCPTKALGLTQSGDPRHVLMLGYGTPLEDWRARGVADEKA